MSEDRWKCIVCGKEGLKRASEAATLDERVYWTPNHWQGQVQQKPVCRKCFESNLTAAEVIIDITEAFDD